MTARILDAGVSEIPESQLQEQNVAGETIAFLREHRHRRADRPWFVCASFSRPHFPLTAPRRWYDRYWPDGVTPPKVTRTGDSAQHPMTIGMARGFQVDSFNDEQVMHARAAYFACVSYLDEVLGDLLATLERNGLLANTVIVYTSDHGELAGEHGMWWKNSWHEAAARVPLLIQTPEHRGDTLPAARLQTPVSLEDLFPTLCALAGATKPDDLPGRDLSQSIHEAREPALRPVFVEAHPTNA